MELVFLFINVLFISVFLTLLHFLSERIRESKKEPFAFHLLIIFILQIFFIIINLSMLYSLCLHSGLKVLSVDCTPRLCRFHHEWMSTTIISFCFDYHFAFSIYSIRCPLLYYHHDFCQIIILFHLSYLIHLYLIYVYIALLIFLFNTFF